MIFTETKIKSNTTVLFSIFGWCKTRVLAEISVKPRLVGKSDGIAYIIDRNFAFFQQFNAFVYSRLGDILGKCHRIGFFEKTAEV